MIRLFILFALCTASLIFCSAARAQAIYDLVLGNATRTVNTPTAGYTQTRLAQFKRTALIYTKRQAINRDSTNVATIIDTQAYYLSEFMQLFLSEIVLDKRSNDAERKDRLMLFVRASLANPLWNDPDEETTHAYMKEEGELTPFSLDTDWQRAFLAVYSVLKKS